MRIMHELRRLASGLQPKTAPIPLVWPGMGQVGHLSERQGVYVNSAYRNHVRASLKDHYEIERIAREVSGGRLGAPEILEASRRESDRQDAVQAIKSMRAAITSFNDTIDARGNAQYYDHFGHKASQTTVANNWSSFMRVAGNPGAASYTNIPGGARMTSASAGAIPLPTIGVSDDLYLTNPAANHVTGNNIAMFVDLLVAAGNIQMGTGTTATTSQNISTTSLSRWTTGEGVNMTLEVTTAGGTATSPTITISYTDQAGNTGNSTGAIAITTSAIAGRLLPVQDGPMIRLAAGDYGVRSMEGCIFSAASTAGVLAALLYKPIIVIPTLTVNVFPDRSTPAQLSGIKVLTSTAGGERPFIGRFVLTSTTSTGTILEWLEFVYS